MQAEASPLWQVLLDLTLTVLPPGVACLVVYMVLAHSPLRIPLPEAWRMIVGSLAGLGAGFAVLSFMS